MTVRFAGALALAVVLATSACSSATPEQGATDAPAGTVVVTISSANGKHPFVVEVAKSEEAQQRGLMYRTDIPLDGGMLFAPYPPSGAPRVASFWMKNTPSPLDIIFIRPDGTIAHIAENTAPGSETPVGSGEPVSAVLEIRGGRSLDLGIAEGDHVAWPGRPAR